MQIQLVVGEASFKFEIDMNEEHFKIPKDILNVADREYGRLKAERKLYCEVLKAQAEVTNGRITTGFENVDACVKQVLKMMPPSQEQCDNCRFCLKEEELRICRKNAPREGGFWPRVHPTDWCGEYKKEQ